VRRIYKRLVKHVKKQVKKINGSSRNGSKKRVSKKSSKKSSKKVTKVSKKQIASKRAKTKRRAPRISKKQCADYILSPECLQIKPFQILKEDGSVIGGMPKLSNDEIVKMYKWMVLARVFDARCIKLQRQGRMGTRMIG
jgi:hypothetical protein